MRYAEKLKDAIQSVRTNKFPGWKQWGHQFFLLHWKEGHSPKAIREVLLWYCSVIREGDLIVSNEDYIPVAYSGANFRKKFMNLEAAMWRRKERQETEEPKVRIKKTYGGLSKQERKKRKKELGW